MYVCVYVYVVYYLYVISFITILTHFQQQKSKAFSCLHPQKRDHIIQKKIEIFSFVIFIFKEENI